MVQGMHQCTGISCKCHQRIIKSGSKCADSDADADDPDIFNAVIGK